MKNFLLLFLLLDITILGKYNVVSGCFANSRHHVHVVSYLPPDSPHLKIHCASGDDDLGNHILNPDQDYNWSFCPNFFPTTLFFCHFWWGTKGRSFDVFREKLNPSPTDHSWWIAKTDGIYFSGKTKVTRDTLLEKKYAWECP